MADSVYVRVLLGQVANGVRRLDLQRLDVPAGPYGVVHAVATSTPGAGHRVERVEPRAGSI